MEVLESKKKDQEYQAIPESAAVKDQSLFIPRSLSEPNSEMYNVQPPSPLMSEMPNNNNNNNLEETKQLSSSL